MIKTNGGQWIVVLSWYQNSLSTIVNLYSFYSFYQAWSNTNLDRRERNIIMWSTLELTNLTTLKLTNLLFNGSYSSLEQQPTEPSKQPIRTRYLGHVIGNQPISDWYFQVRSVPGLE